MSTELSSVSSRANRSASIAALAAALAKAQGAMEGAAKGSENPFFKSKYADLAAVWDACREPLSKNELAVIQVPVPASEAGKVAIETIMAHASGEWISGTLEMKPVKDDPQGVGSAITYIRRYGLQAMVGIAPEDDDGNGASGNHASGNGSTKKAFGNGNAKPAERVADPGQEKIEAGQATNLHMTFRTALRKPLQKESEALLAEWLTQRGYVDADGKASALMIAKDFFFETRDEAELHAKTL